MKLKYLFLFLFLQNDWMGQKEKETAKDKLDYMRFDVGAPEELMTDEKLEEYYQNLEFDRSSFVKTKLAVQKFRADKKFRKFRSTADIQDWKHGIAAYVCNACYKPYDNSLGIF